MGTKATFCAMSSFTALHWLRWSAFWCSCRLTSIHSRKWLFIRFARFDLPCPMGQAFLVTANSTREQRLIPGKAAVDARIVRELRAIVGDRGLITSPEELRTYECDGLTNFRVMPGAVLLPDSTEQVQAILRVCYRE